MAVAREEWPELPLEAWLETYATLHRIVQIAGKVKLALAPMVNHWWHVALLPTARGLTTGPMPCQKRALELRFDFLDHCLELDVSDGSRRYVPLIPRTVADFYREVLTALDALGIECRINPLPQEIPNAIPLDEDLEHHSYDAAAVERWFRALLSASFVLQEFRGRFRGKCSPVHFFWGSFDLACSRFSGRAAPPRPGADLVTREAYSDEVASAGFWPGDTNLGRAAFYSYFSPVPDGFSEAEVQPAQAYFHPQLKEFLLDYDVVRRAPSPRALLLDFFQSTYDAGADLAGWDRDALERHGDEASRPGHVIEPPTTGGPDIAGP